MQNADREAVKPTTAVLNNSKTAVHAMGLGVSSGVGDVGFSQSSGSSTESDRVGRFPQQNLSDDPSDSEDEKRENNLWKFEKVKMLVEKASQQDRSVGRKAKSGRLKNSAQGGTCPSADYDDAFLNKSSELTRMISDNDEENNDLNDDDQMSNAIILARACSSGDMDTVRNMLKQSSEASETNEGDSYLSLAASTGSYDLCQFLLSYGSNVDDRGAKCDCTPLMEAASMGHKRIVQLLCQHGANVNAKSQAGNTPLHYAACGGNDEIIVKLLEYGAKVEEHNENGHTALMEAANAGHISTARLLLDAGAGINTHSNEFKETALTLAAYKGHMEMVQFLLKNGADIEHKTDEMHTPLMEAAMDGHVGVAKLLLECGAQVNMSEDSFESPLTLAACGGHIELASVLIEHGANLEEANDEGYTPLMEAAREGHQEMVALLLAKGAKVNAQTQNQETALTYACKNGHTEIAEVLLRYRAKLDHESEGGQTALMKAARVGHLSTVQFLISQGADVNKATHNNDQTVLSLACTYGHVQIVDLLLRSGANPAHKLQEGSTMLIEASKGGHTDIAQLLFNWSNPIQYQNVINDELELSQSSPSQTSLDDQTSRVPIQGLGNVVPPQDPMFAFSETYQDYKDTIIQKFSTMEQQYASGDRRSSSCQHAGCDGDGGYFAGHNSCEEVSKNLLRSPRESGSSSSDNDEGDDEDGDDYGDDEDDNGDGESEEQQRMLSKSLLKYQGLTLLPNDLKKMLDGIQDLTKSDKASKNQQIIERIMKNENFDSFLESYPPSKNSNHRHTDSFSSSSDKSIMHPENISGSPLKQMQNGFALMAGDQRAKHPSATTARAESKTPAESVSCDCLVQSSAKKKVGKVDCRWKEDNPQLRCSAKGLEHLCSPVQTNLPLSEGNQRSCGSGELDQSGAKKQLLFEAAPVGSQQQNRVFAKGNQMFGYDITQAQRKLGKQDHSTHQQAVSSGQWVLDGQPQQATNMRSLADEKSLNPQEQLAQQMQAFQKLASQQSLSLDISQQQQFQQQQQQDGCIVQYGNTSLNAVGSLSDASGENLYNQQTSHYHHLQQAIQKPQDSLYQHHQHPVNDRQLPSNQMLSCASGIIPSVPLVTPHANENVVLNSNMSTLAGAGVDKGAQTMLHQCPLRLAPQQQLQVMTLNQTCDGQAKAPGNAMFEYSDAIHHPSSSSPNAPLPNVVQTLVPLIEVDAQTEVTHDSALSVACAGGHTDLASVLLSRGAKLELRDKKGLTPLLHAASAGYVSCLELLLNNGADIEAQSDRTKDTALSLACANGRHEVVELLLKRGANKEHRNISDYTPLSQAASGGYLNIIHLLLSYSAEINSRTGSKLGISPLMLAAMNGHTESVILLLDNGSDINAQIETNRNTALTLACFQGRHEVVTVLADRKANLEHRAKTGLTPLMEAATGGYVEVGRVLLEKGADVAAAPVPSSRDTALTIAADKGQFRFVELLLQHGAPFDVKNKKGATALWLACNGGHLEVVQLLIRAGADVDSQDNRKVSCLVAAFRKGHVKVVKLLVKNVTQFPSDQECARFISGVTDQDILARCQECMETIMTAKERQAEEAEKNADSLLQELQQEKSLVEKKRAARERKREKKRQKKKEKTVNMKDTLRILDDDEECTAKAKLDDVDMIDDDFLDDGAGKATYLQSSANDPSSRDSGDSGGDKNGSSKKDNKKGQKTRKSKSSKSSMDDDTDSVQAPILILGSSCNVPTSTCQVSLLDSSGKAKISIVPVTTSLSQLPSTISCQSFASVADPTRSKKEQGKSLKNFAASGIGDLDDFNNPDDIRVSVLPGVTTPQSALAPRPEVKAASSMPAKTKAVIVQPMSASVLPSRSARLGSTPAATRSGNNTQKKGQRKEDNWKDASKKMRKIDVPARAVSRVIGRAGCNINAIREHSAARIDLDKLKTSDDAVVTIRGLPEQINQAAELVLGLIRESDKDIEQLIAMLKSSNGSGQARIDTAPSSGWKSTMKGTSSSSAWDSGMLNVWENRSLKGSSTAPRTSIISSSFSTDKSTNVWNRTAKEPSTLTDLSVSSSNVWDNSMADGIGVGTGATGTKPLASGTNASNGKLLSVLNKQESVEQRPPAMDDYSKPQPIRSFPIGAWTPVRGNSSGGPQTERTILYSHPLQSSLEMTPVSNGTSSEAGSFAGAKTDQMTLVPQEEAPTDTSTQSPGVLFSRAEPGESRGAEGRTSECTELTSVHPIASSFHQVVPAVEKVRCHFSEMSIGEYSPFNNNFSPLADTVIPKKFMNCGRMTFSDMASPRMSGMHMQAPSDMVVDIALQAKAPGYRPPGQVQRMTSSPSVDASSFQAEVKAPLLNSDNDHLGLSMANFHRSGDRPLTPGAGDYSPFSDGIEKASKLASQVDDSFCSVLPTKPDAYITTQSPMLLPRISSTLNPDAPNFNARPFFFKPPSSYEGSNVFPAPSYRLPIGHIPPAAVAAFQVANSFNPNNAVKDNMSAQSMGYSGSVIMPNHLEPSMMMRRFSLDDSSASAPQMVAQALPSVSNPPSPNDDAQTHQFPVGEERRVMLRPIGTERTIRRPNSMTGTSGNLPNTNDLQPWPYSPNSAVPDWQRQGYVGGPQPVPLGVIPNMQDAMIPHLSSSSHHPAMMGQIPVQQKILAINNAMFDQSLQTRPSYLVQNGMAMPFGAGAYGPAGAMAHQPLPYPHHRPSPSPAPGERTLMDSCSSWPTSSLTMPDGGVNVSAAACEDDRLRTWSMWNGPSNL